MKKKERLDKILIDKGYFETKSKAQAAIMAGDVKINDEMITKAGQFFNPDEKMIVEIKSMPYVSRGGFKLEKALKIFNINLQERTCLDAGASTGGFSDCMLQCGASKIYAVDVGYGQLAWKVRSNPKVKVIERMNIKNCVFEDIYQDDEILPDFCAMDLSFISILKVLPNIKRLMSATGQIVALIKPQFEAGREFVGKNGVVRDSNVHISILQNIIEQTALMELFAEKLTFSPIKGPAGNIEYLILFNFTDSKANIELEKTVNEAFQALQ